ncbi:hypothetical protein PINS_up023133 [Pythium insidiosum]|nr:hypothetical protein PINS_up009713 [Pythium insidiosum]GLE10861.1 hypothetical protein PINS_up023133 [Pythium insidiosum]
MPPALQSLRNLISIEVTKSVLARWPADAALTARYHTKMLSVTILQTNMTELPLGLRSADFPPKLDDIEICDSSFTALPVEIDEAWGDTYYVFVERSELVSFPEALTRMKIAQLSLSGNHIATIPREFLCGRDIDELHVSSNPMIALPRADELSDCGLTRIGRLGFVDTRVGALPALTVSSVTVVQAIGSPLCLENSTAPTSSSARPRVDCSEVLPLQYPLYLVSSD